MNDARATPRLSISCQEVVELVTDYLEGVLDSDTAAEVEAHLGLCDGCYIYVEQMRATIRALGNVPVSTLTEDAQAELVRAFRDLHGSTAPR
jgi:anti-sigma factor RsiW